MKYTDTIKCLECNHIQTVGEAYSAHLKSILSASNGILSDKELSAIHSTLEDINLALNRPKLALNLEEAIRRSGLQIHHLSELVGISNGQIYNYINGKTVPTIPNLIKLARVLRVSLDSLLEGVDE